MMQDAGTGANVGWQTHIRKDTNEASGLKKEGFAVIEDVLTPAEVSRLIEALAALFTDVEDTGGRGVYGVRGLLEAAPIARELAVHRTILLTA